MSNLSQLLVCFVIAIGFYYQSGVEAQVFAFGSCPSVEVVSNFNVSQYTGVWYENRKYFAIFEAGLRCVTAEYQLSGSTVTVKNVGKRLITGSTQTVTGTARQLEPPNGKLGVTFASIPFTPKDAPYWVLDTDYTTYSVVWSCSNRGPISSRIAWILTRSASPSDTTINTALSVLSKYSIDTSRLRVTSRTNC